MSEQIFPAIAFLDGRYTMGLPPDITAATVIDAISHAVEGYLACRATPMGQLLALESLRYIGKVLPDIVAGHHLDLQAREALLVASMLAGIVIAQSGTTAVHAMGYSLTYFKGIDHGKANGLLMAEFLRFIARQRIDDVNALIIALDCASIDELERDFTTLLGKVTLSDEEIAAFGAIAIKAGNIQNTNPKPTQEDLLAIMQRCFKQGE